MNSKYIYFLFLLSFLSLSLYAQRPITELDNYIEQARQQWNVPGLSVTIVKDGEVLLAKGYGVRSIDSNTPVDEHTLFMLGSTTKAMTATAMAMLVDEGLIKWTDKVIDHLPWFQLKDPFITRELTIKDLFTHNSGLGNADLLWVLWDYSNEEIVRRLRYLDASYSLRGGYTYQNIMYATAGLVIESVSGMRWSEFIHERLFEPLGMNRSCALKSCAESFKNRSTPHYPTDKGIIEIIDSNADSIGAAGSAWSSASDISKWMNFFLNNMEVDGTPLVSKENYEFLQEPHVVIPKRQFYPTATLTKPRFTTYSMGWFQHDYQGDYVQFHTGSLNGSGAIIGLLPDHKLGVYVMVNLDHAEVRHAIMYKVFDFFTGKSDRDWSTDLLSLYTNIDDGRKNRLKDRDDARVKNTSPVLLNEDLMGTYVNEYLGKLEVVNDQDVLKVLCRKDRTIALTHWHYDTFMGKIEQYEHDTGTLIDFNKTGMGEVSFTLYGHKFVRQD